MSAPAPITRGATISGLGPFVAYPVQARPAESSKPVPTLLDYLMALWRGKWIIAGFVFLSVATAYYISKKATRIYEASAVIDIDRTQPMGIMGADAAVTFAPDMDQVIATQIRLIQSDAVLRPVVDKFDLISYENGGKAAPNGPIRLRNLKISRPPNTYLLQVGYRHKYPEVAAEVANAISLSYVEQLKKLRQGAWSNVSAMTQRQLQGLKDQMERSAGELARLQQQLGMVDPEDKTNVLSSRLLQLNADYARAQSELAAKEAAFENVRGGIPEAAEASTKGDVLTKLLERKNEALQKFSDLKAMYGENHPEYRRVQSQVKEIEDQLQAAYRKSVKRAEADLWEARLRESKVQNAYMQAKTEADRLAAHTLQYRMLKQKADADRLIHDELARKVSEAQINTELKNSGVRIADAARADARPVSPNTPMNCAIAFVGSFILAGGLVITRDSGKPTLRSIEDVRTTIPCDVVSLLPTVPAWRRSRGLSAQVASAKMLASGHDEGHAASRYREAMRMLRGRLTGLGRLQSTRVVAVVSPGSGDGRSTTAANLAVACANLGRRTLLIDADIRRPTLHTLYSSTAPSAGLCEVLSGEKAWKETVIRPASQPNLHLLPAGGPNHTASELLTDRLTTLLEDVLPVYDFVVIDSPPFLRYSEAVDIVRAADAAVVVARANYTDPKKLSLLEQYMDRLGVNIAAVALNEATIE